MKLLKSILLRQRSGNHPIREVFVYQMGKVGSTSLIASIKRAGIPAYQSHFLDTPSFHETVEMFNQHSSMGDKASRHTSIQLQKNLVLRNRLIRYQNNEMKSGDRLGIITLVRDPLAWYFSNLSQNFYQIENPLRRWLVAQDQMQDDDELTQQHLQFFFTELFQCFERVVPDMDQNHSDIIEQHFIKAGKTPSGNSYRFIYGQVAELNRVHFWFDKHFTQLLDTDVLRYDFDKSRGYHIFHRDNVDIMLLQFEKLGALQGELARFLGLSSLPEKRLNQSKPHSLGRLISQTRKTLQIPENFREKYFSSEYYSTFYDNSDADKPSLVFSHLQKRRTAHDDLVLKRSPINDISHCHRHKKTALESFLNFSNQNQLPEWPLKISLDISNQCDLACAMCTPYSPLNQQKYSHLPADARKFFAIEYLQELQEELQHALLVNLGGYGEPTLHPEFRQLIGKLASYEVLTEFSTHGLHLDETLCDHLVKHCVHKVNINLSAACKEDYDSIYINGDYARVLNNIQQLSASKKKYGAHYPIITVTSLAFDFQLKKFPEFVRIMAQHGAEAVILEPLNTCDELPQLHHLACIMNPQEHTAILKEAQNIAREHGLSLQTNAFTSTAHLPGNNLQEKAQFRHFGEQELSKQSVNGQQTGQLCHEAAAIPEPTTHSRKDADVGKDEGFLVNEDIPCFEPMTSLHIGWDGSIYPCSLFHKEHALGHLNGKTPGSGVWHTKSLTQLRQRALVQELAVPGCTDCRRFSLYPRQHNLPHLSKQYMAWFYRIFNVPFHPRIRNDIMELGSNREILNRRNSARKNLYLHIGSPKTGTTSIQKYLSDHFKYHLHTYGLLYPKSGRRMIAHHPLAADLRTRFNQDTIPDHCYGDVKRGETWENLTAELRDRSDTCNKVVISSEDFFTLFRNSSMDALEEIKNQLSDYRVIVVVYLRRQDEYIESLYNEGIKTTLQSKESADDLLHKHTTTRMNYHQILTAWSDVFGKDNVILRPFHAQALLNGDTVADFLHVIGVNDYQKTTSRVHTNRKLGREEIIFKRELNKHYQDKLKCNKVFNGIREKLEYPMDYQSTLLTSTTYESIRKISEAVNHSLSRDFYANGQLFPDFPSTDSLEFLEDKDISMRPYLEEVLTIVDLIPLAEADKNKLLKSIHALIPSLVPAMGES